MTDKNRRDSKFDEELEELDELEEKIKKRSRFEDEEEDLDESEEKSEKEERRSKRDDDEEDDDRDADRRKEEKKKSKDEDLEDDEGESAGTKIIAGIVVLAIIGIVAFMLFSGGSESAEFEVSFDASGGTTISSLVVKEDGTIQKPADPTREGYMFVGWYYNGAPFDFSTKIISDIKLEARWVSETEAKVSGVTLEQDKLTILPDATATLTAIVSPATAINRSVRWESSNNDVVTVDQNGTIRALKVGTATITVTTNDGSFTAKATVTVSTGVVATTGVTLNRTTANLGVNNSLTLTATVAPAKATNKGLRWSSSDTKIATVSNGRVTGVADGTATITVTTVDGSFKAECVITVKTIKVTGVTISGSKNRTMTVGDKIKLAATVAPADASNKKVTWKSSDTTVATVDSNGNVKAVGAGSATITATTTDGGKTATVNLTVKVKAVVYKYTITKKPENLGGEQYYLVNITRDGNNVGSELSLIMTTNGEEASTIKEGKAFRIDSTFYSKISSGSAKITIKFTDNSTLTIGK